MTIKQAIASGDFSFFAITKIRTISLTVLPGHLDCFMALITLDVGAILFVPAKDILPSILFVSYKVIRV